MPSNIVTSFANKTGKSVEEVEKLWDKAKDLAKNEYPEVKEDDDRFYSIVTGILKKMLRVEESVNFTEESVISNSISFATDMINKEEMLLHIPVTHEVTTFLKNSRKLWVKLRVSDWTEAYLKSPELCNEYRGILNSLISK